ncbi:MAG: nucleotidyltransferase domain-containing protein [Desulfosalsimonadaceae bacterium]
MAQRAAGQMIYDHIKKYIKILQENNISIWRLYMFGSHAKGTARSESDIDLAVFWDQDEIDDFDADIQLLQMTRNVNFSIEPHSFSRKDFENPDPFVQEIIRTGERIV